MASLLELLFGTMPLSGVMDAAERQAGSRDRITLGHMVRKMEVHPSPPTLNIGPASPDKGTVADKAPLWGWHIAPHDPATVTKISCRVRDMAFAKYEVLTKLEWGYAPLHDAKTIRKEVLVVYNGRESVLPLTGEYHLVSFKTQDGYIKPDDDDPVWPLESWHDESLLHVFAYDLDRAKGTILPVTANKRDKPAIEAMMGRLKALTQATEDDERLAGPFLFVDDLWDPAPVDDTPTATVPGDADLNLDAVRIMVACSLTCCRERDDYQPGKLGGVARLYPHVMVIATSALDRIEAGIHFVRPETTNVMAPGYDEHAMHHHSEDDVMLPAIKNLLIADSNEKGMVLIQLPLAPGPIPVWANLFNYYVPDPIENLDPDVRDKPIPIVRRSVLSERNKVGWVSRDCWDISIPDEKDPLNRTKNQGRLVKLPRQGYFDNIHIAPRMAIGDSLKEVILHYSDPPRVIPVTPQSKAAWKMNEVVMAPFCAHDCFHMHWRWSDNKNKEPGAYGWGPANPWKLPGRVMVPENQDVWLQLLGHAEFSYLAHAHDAPQNIWQVFCHHGAGYAVRIGFPMDFARRSQHEVDKMILVGGNGWASFYWRLRYRLVPVEKYTAQGEKYLDADIEERFAFNNEAAALKL